MQAILHTRTLLFVSGFTSLVLFLCMLYIWKRQKTYPGFLRWVFSSLTNAVGMLLISFRDVVSVFFSVIVADVLLMISMMLITSGFSLFAEKKPRDTVYIAVLLIFTVFMVGFTYGWPSFTLRVVVYSAIQAALCIIAAYIIYRQLPMVLPTRHLILVWFFILCAVMPILRAVASIVEAPEASEMLQAGFLHQLVVLIGLELYIVADIGLIILNAQRINYELNKTKDEIRTLTGLIPICANCKKIRDDKGSWNQLESYISGHIDVEFSHGICPDCMKKLYPDIEFKERPGD